VFKPSDSLYEELTGRVAGAKAVQEAYTYFSARSPDGNKPYLYAFLTAVYDLNQDLPMPYDFYGLMGQFSQESGNASSSYFLQDGNPVGIGISYGGEASPWAGRLTPEDAALVWLAELAVHTYQSAAVPKGFERAGILDSHLAKVQKLRASTVWPTVRSWQDLCAKVPPYDFVWAADQEYGTGIAGRVNAIWPGIKDASTGVKPMPSPLNMTRDLIPPPAMLLDIIDVNQRYTGLDCRGYDWLGYRNDPKALAVHRSQAPSGGSNSGYFHTACCPALTDLEINNLSGAMRRFVRIPGDSPSGWANGVVQDPYGDGLAFVNLYGITPAVNRDIESLEILGWFVVPGEVSEESPLSVEAEENISQWFAWRGHNYGIRWDTFPLIPEEGNRSYIIWHEELTYGTGKRCPGDLVKARTPSMIARAVEIMRLAQTKGITPMPSPTVIDVAPDGKAYPAGLDSGLLALAFGSVVKANKTYSFNPKGTVSRAWYNHFKGRGIFPSLVHVFEDTHTGREVCFFANGEYLYRPNGKSAFKWGA
jgi:hypothetical protein